MPTITYVQPDGARRSVTATLGDTVMNAAVSNDVQGIVAECGGSCSCATCHVYVGEAWQDAAGPPSAMEEDMLDFAVDVRESSRLSCQIEVTEALDGLVVHVPETQG